MLPQPFKEDFSSDRLLQITESTSRLYLLLDIAHISSDYQDGHISALRCVLDELTSVLEGHFSALVGVVENKARWMMLNKLKGLSAGINSLRYEPS